MKKLFLALFVLFIFLFIFQPNVFAASWVQVSDVDYIDKNSITTYVDELGNPQPNMKTVWIKSLNEDGFYNDIEKLFNKKISYSKKQHIFDFSRNMIALKSNVFYDKDGNVVYSYTYKKFELAWISINPESTAEYWSYLVSHKRQLNKMYKEQKI